MWFRSGVELRLLENQAKELFRTFGIPVPHGFVVSQAEEINEIERPVVIKALVLSGGRGKAGGVRSASSLNEARSAAREILSLHIGGQSVERVLVEEKLPVVHEIYLALTIDRSLGLPLLMVSTEGGMNIESVPDEALRRWTVHPFVGVRDYVIREISKTLSLEGKPAEQMAFLLSQAWSLFWKIDCELLEINPLILTKAEELIAADAKLIVNDDALYRHLELPSSEGGSPLEQMARKKGISLVQLSGDIGVIANGAGLTMATLDNLSLYGGEGGVFLDLGGTDDPKKVEDAFSLMLDASPKVILLNIFGGITKCDTVARGVIKARERFNMKTPLVARIRGVNEDLAKKMLTEAGVTALSDLDAACQRAAELGGRE